MSNVLIVHAHPEPASLTSALKDVAVEKLRTDGHAVQVSDLYAMGWKPLADAHDFTERRNPDRLIYVAVRLSDGGYRRRTGQAFMGGCGVVQLSDVVVRHARHPERLV